MFDILDNVSVRLPCEPDLKQMNIISMNAVCGKAPGVHVVKDLK